MNLLILVAIFIFGSIIGSFLNVVIFRYNTGKSLGGRSGCLSCGIELKPQLTLPIVGYFQIMGRCHTCKSKISIQYPLVELATALTFLLLFLISSSISTFIFYALVFAILIVIFVYDVRHKIIPNGLVYFLIVLSLIYRLIETPISYINDFPFSLDLLAGPIFFLPFFLLWFFSGGKWIGLGDGKLAIFIGWFLGFVDGLSAVVLSFWIGALFSIILMLILRLKGSGKDITMKTEIPFAPFMVIGFIIQFLFGIDILGIGILFF